MKLKLERIISGGQTGADQGGLEAAAILGLKTGGTMPRGYRTETGPRRDLAELYGLVAISDSNFLTRTRFNVFDATATVIFGKLSGGSKQTQEICKQELKPVIFIPFPELDATQSTIIFSSFITWINPRILNVAGNRESKNLGIQTFVRDFLVKTITDLRTEPNQ